MKSVQMMGNTLGQYEVVGSPMRGQHYCSNGLSTISIMSIRLIGEVVIEGSLESLPESDSDWFVLESVSFPNEATNTTDEDSYKTIGLNIQGNYTWLRAKLVRDKDDVPDNDLDINKFGYIDNILLNN